MKKAALSTILVSLIGIGLPATAHGGGRGGYVGVDLGVMKPVLEPFPRFVHTGGTVAPYAGYLFNDYIGFQTQLHFLGGGTKDIGNQDGDTTFWGGLAGGPVAVLPLGPVSLNATFQPGIFTSFADEALTDTSFGFSTGAGINFHLTDQFALGLWGRFNRLYQQVHGEGDPEYVTAGLGLTYFFTRAEELPPPPPEPIPAPAQRMPEVKRKVVPRAVYFDFDKSNIRPDARATLDEAIRIIKEFGYTAVICEGHTDSRGTDDYNQALSLRRSRSVREYLIAGGIPESAISTEGFGESRPVATNETDDGRQQNRRVELRVSE